METKLSAKRRLQSDLLVDSIRDRMANEHAAIRDFAMMSLRVTLRTSRKASRTVALRRFRRGREARSWGGTTGVPAANTRCVIGMTCGNVHCYYDVRNSWKAQSRGDGYSPSGTLGGTRLVGGARSTSTVFALGVTERRVVFSSRCFTGASAVPRILDIARNMRFAVVLLCRGTRFTARRHERFCACPKTFDF